VAIGRLFARLLLQARLCLLVVNLQEADTILEGAQEKNVSFLVVGDPFG
jgi:diphthamide biosynthesis methyltransferase